mgnify:FL=1
MAKYLYFRATATLADDDQADEGSNMVLASDLISCEATSDTTSTLRFKPRMNAFAAGGNAAADQDNLTDSVVLTHGANKHKAVFGALAKAINSGVEEDMIVVADDVDSKYISADVTAVGNFTITAAQA